MPQKMPTMSITVTTAIPLTLFLWHALLLQKNKMPCYHSVFFICNTISLIISPYCPEAETGYVHLQPMTLGAHERTRGGEGGREDDEKLSVNY